MYLAWSLVYLGLALIANSLRIAFLLPAVALYTHYLDLRREEQYLEAQFGDEYREYQRSVRRYL